MSDKKWFYFRFKEDMLDQLDLIHLGTMRDGWEYIVILLQIYALSVRDGGFFKLRKKNGKLDVETLAERTHHSDGVMMAAIQYLMGLGLIEVSQSNEYTLFKCPQVINNIGSTSARADAQRIKYHAEKLGSLGLGVMSNIILDDGELEALQKVTTPIILSRTMTTYSIIKSRNEHDINNSDFSNLQFMLGVSNPNLLSCESKPLRETEHSADPAVPAVPRGTHKNIRLSEAEWNNLQKRFAEPLKLVNYASQKIFQHDYKMKSDFAFCVKIGKEDGWQTLGDKIESEEKIKQARREADEREKAVLDELDSQNQHMRDSKDMISTYEKYRGKIPDEILDTLIKREKTRNGD